MAKKKKKESSSKEKNPYSRISTILGIVILTSLILAFFTPYLSTVSDTNYFFSKIIPALITLGTFLLMYIILSPLVLVVAIILAWCGLKDKSLTKGHRWFIRIMMVVETLILLLVIVAGVISFRG